MAKHRANGEGNLRKKTDGRWEIRYYDPREPDPKKQRKYITDKSQQIVIEKWNKIKAEITGNSMLLSNDNPTLKEWLAIWIKEYKASELRETTFESYEMQINTYISPLIGNIKLKQITGIEIQRFYNKLQDKKTHGGFGLSAASVGKVKTVLSGCFRQAVINRLMSANPLGETKAPKIEDAEIRILTKEEQKQFIAVLPFYNTGNMFALSLATGLRVGELCALNVNDINREDKYINISKSASRRKDKETNTASIKIGLPKTKNSIRKIPLLPSVEVILDRQAQLVSEMKSNAGDKWIDNTLAFPTNVGNIHSASGMRKSLERILLRAGLPHMTVHALRHTYATTALNSGVAAQNVARVLGHKDGATTLKFYAHYINAEAMTQLEKLETQNISHLGITSEELQKLNLGAEDTIKKSDISEKIDDAINRAKNFNPKKSVEMVLSVCEDILCQPMDKLSVSEKELLLNVLSKHIVMKRRLEVQEREKKKNTQRER